MTRAMLQNSRGEKYLSQKRRTKSLPLQQKRKRIDVYVCVCQQEGKAWIQVQKAKGHLQKTKKYAKGGRKWWRKNLFMQHLKDTWKKYISDKGCRTERQRLHIRKKSPNKGQEKGYSDELRVVLNATQNLTLSEEVQKKEQESKPRTEERSPEDDIQWSWWRNWAVKMVHMQKNWRKKRAHLM